MKHVLRNILLTKAGRIILATTTLLLITGGGALAYYQTHASHSKDVSIGQAPTTSSPSPSPSPSESTSPKKQTAQKQSANQSNGKPKSVSAGSTSSASSSGGSSGSTTPSPSSSPSPSSTPSPATDPLPTGVSGSWALKFDDEFDGTSLDTTKWAKNWYSGTNNVTSSAANISVSGGYLGLTLSDSSTGAIVTTKPGGGTTGFTLGVDCVWEARILFPSDGTNIYNWPAFWVLNDTPGDTTVEIDIAEPWDGIMQTNYHTGGSNPSHSYSAYRDGQFHVWTLYRTSTTMYFYVDGALVYTLPKASGDNGHPQYAILNVGRTSSGNHTVYGAQSTVKVDYVRAWQ